MITICVNGETKQVEKLTTIGQLISLLNIKIEHIVIELNGKAEKAVNIQRYELKEKDNLDIVHFMGGGF